MGFRTQLVFAVVKSKKWFLALEFYNTSWEGAENTKNNQQRILAYFILYTITIVLKGRKMKMKVHDTKFLTIILSLLVFATTSALCSAQQWSRTEKGEIYGIFQTMDGDESSALFEVEGLETKLKGKVKVHDTDVYGLGLAYNFTDHLNLNTDFLLGTIDTAGKLEGQENEWNPTIFVWDVNLDYNFWKSRFSPLVTGGLGCFYFSGDGYSETDFSYNIGAGLRWDALDFLFIKAVYRMTWTKMDDHEHRILLDGISLGVGYMY